MKQTTFFIKAYRKYNSIFIHSFIVFVNLNSQWKQDDFFFF